MTSYETLVQALQLAALDPTELKAVLPSFVNAADEVALIFSDSLASYDIEDTRMDNETAVLLAEVDDLFNSMSNDKSEWTLEAMEIGSNWKRIRLLTSHVLDRLDEPLLTPGVGFITFVEG